MQTETQTEYDKRTSNRRYTRRPPLPRGVGETLSYDNALVQKGGVIGAFGVGTTAGVLERVATKSLKRTPIGVATGYIGGQIDSFKAMRARMEQHDKSVDYYRAQKKK